MKKMLTYTLFLFEYLLLTSLLFEDYGFKVSLQEKYPYNTL